MVNYGSLPFAEQLAFFRAKLNLPTQRWDDLLGAAHDRAFVVAGAMQADLLQDLRAAVDKALAEGTTLEQFRKDFKKIVAERGWTGWTGEGTKAGEAWRTRVIYETNLFTSYSAGRYRQMKEVADLRPYWRYRHSDAVAHPRQEHLAWNRKILHADDPWWKMHYPPNGWGCRCFVETLADRDLERMGIPKPPMNRGESMPHNGKDPKTGLPLGVDKGWDYQPGRTWFPDLDKYPEQIARTMVANNLQDGVFQRWYEFLQSRVAEELKKPEYVALLAQKGKEAKDTLLKKLRADQAHGEAYPVAILNEEARQLLGVSTQVVVFSDYDAVKQIMSREGQAFTAEDYLAAQATIEQAKLIVQVGDYKYAFLPQGRKVYVAILQRTEAGHEVYLKSFRFGFGPEEAKALRKRGKVLKDDWEQAKG